MILLQYAEVLYVGYGNKETVWLKDLLPSTGVATVQANVDEPIKIGTDEIKTDEPVEEAGPEAKQPVKAAFSAQADKVDSNLNALAAAVPVKVHTVPVQEVNKEKTKLSTISNPDSNAAKGHDIPKWKKGKKTFACKSYTVEI